MNVGGEALGKITKKIFTTYVTENKFFDQGIAATKSTNETNGRQIQIQI